MIHCLHREQIILASLDGVWEYFANPYNLNSITPPNMNFEIVSGGDVSKCTKGKSSNIASSLRAASARFG